MCGHHNCSHSSECSVHTFTRTDKTCEFDVRKYSVAVKILDFSVGKNYWFCIESRDMTLTLGVKVV